MPMPRTARQVISQAIRENRHAERLCYALARNGCFSESPKYTTSPVDEKRRAQDGPRRCPDRTPAGMAEKQAVRGLVNAFRE